MALSRVTPNGWLEETGALSRVTPTGWVQETQSTNTTYTYAGSGSVTFSGVATVAKIKSYAGSGTVTFSGAGTTTKIKSYAGSGTVTFSGAATTTLVATGATTYTYAGSGTLTFSGSAVLAKIKAYLGSGSVVYSGAATTSYTPGISTYTYSGSGSITFSGLAELTKTKVYNGSGDIIFSGAALTKYTEFSVGSSRAHKEEKRYPSVSWSMDWTQPIIKQVEEVVPKETLKLITPLKKKSIEPSKYLEKLIQELELYIIQLQDAEAAVASMEKYGKLLANLTKTIEKQKQYEVEKIKQQHALVIKQQEEEKEIKFLMKLVNEFYFD